MRRGVPAGFLALAGSIEVDGGEGSFGSRVGGGGGGDGLGGPGKAVGGVAFEGGGAAAHFYGWDVLIGEDVG